MKKGPAKQWMSSPLSLTSKTACFMLYIGAPLVLFLVRVCTLTSIWWIVLICLAGIATTHHLLYPRLHSCDYIAQQTAIDSPGAQRAWCSIHLLCRFLFTLSWNNFKHDPFPLLAAGYSECAALGHVLRKKNLWRMHTVWTSNLEFSCDEILTNSSSDCTL